MSNTINLSDPQWSIVADGVSDASGGIQQALNAAIALLAQGIPVRIYAPGGRYLMSHQVTVTVPRGAAGGYTCFNLEGDGPWDTKFIAGVGNRDGCFAISYADDGPSMSTVRCQGFSLVSNIDARINGSLSNGTAFRVTNLLGSLNDPLPSINALPSVVFSDVWVAADRSDAGEAQFHYGVWENGFQIDYAWCPQFVGCQILTPQRAAGAVTNHGVIQCSKYAILLNHCYRPYAMNISINGYFIGGFCYFGAIPPNAINHDDPGRCEGGALILSDIGGCARPVYILMPFSKPAAIYPDEFRCIGCHLNGLEFGVYMENWQWATFDAVHVLVPSAPFGSENLVAAWRLHNVSQIQIVGGSSVNGFGYLVDQATNAACGIRVTGHSTFVTIGPNFGWMKDGVGVHIETKSLGAWPEDWSGSLDSIFIRTPTWGGRTMSTLPNYVKLHDPDGRAIWQDYDIDRRLITNRGRDGQFTISEDQLILGRDGASRVKTGRSLIDIYQSALSASPDVRLEFAGGHGEFDGTMQVDGNLALPRVAGLGMFANDSAAAAAGVPLHGVYMRIPDGCLVVRLQ